MFVLGGAKDNRMSKIQKITFKIGIISDAEIQKNIESPNNLLNDVVTDREFVIRESPLLGPWNGKQEDAQQREQ